MNFVSNIWLKMNFLFDPVQRIFNGNFWEVFAKRYKDAKNITIVDLASGTGELRKHIDSKSYLGVDINPEYIAYSKKRFSKFSNTNFLLKDITKVKIPKSDFVFLVSAMHHLSDRDINLLCQNLQKQEFEKFVIIDGIPKGMLSTPLKWLDAVLGGGEYFRDEKQIAELIKRHFVVTRLGKFSAKNSFYVYPFVEASRKPHKPKAQ